MEHRYWQYFGNLLVAATPSGDRIILSVMQHGGNSVMYQDTSFQFDPADAEKIGYALVAAAHAARPALAEGRPAETEAV